MSHRVFWRILFKRQFCVQIKKFQGTKERFMEIFVQKSDKILKQKINWNENSHSHSNVWPYLLFPVYRICMMNSYIVELYGKIGYWINRYSIVIDVVDINFQFRRFWFIFSIEFSSIFVFELLKRFEFI